jgi:hypothetical protein
VDAFRELTGSNTNGEYNVHKYGHFRLVFP